jgi:hypothetical protein
MNTSDALVAMREMLVDGQDAEHVRYLVEFIASSARGVIK